MRVFVVLLSLLGFQASFAADGDFHPSAAERIAIQEGGRVKPLGTYAAESVQTVTGKTSWQGEPPIGTFLSWIANPEAWESREFVAFHREGARRMGGVDPQRSRFSPKELAHSSGLVRALQAVEARHQAKEKLSPDENEILAVANRLSLFEGIFSGSTLALIPKAGDWSSVAPTSQEWHASELSRHLGQLLVAFAALNQSQFDAAAEKISALQRAAVPDRSALATAIGREVLFNHVRPYQKAWILYLTAFVLLLIGMQVPRSKAARLLGWGFFLAGFLVHSGGIVLRCLITGRPPVTNMYESTIWVPWGVVLFSLLIAIRAGSRKKLVAAVASAVAVVVLLIADNVPAVLDPTIRPLVPVLRSNYWLTIHVLTITLSYAAFALSLGIGNAILGMYFAGSNKERIQAATRFMYRAVQFGVVLLAAGTILGGVWADYSWGRFWGWDPKEVWALTALLGYLAVLHGRYTGWLGPFGFVAGVVVCFLGVLMAWYGVNFVLGVGLHSYGFGGGGLGYVSAFVALQLGFIAAVAMRVHRPGKRAHA